MKLLQEISKCTICKELPMGPNPIVSAHKNSRIVIIGQAPGRIVHESGVPWDDKSGQTLREWLQVTDEEFYNSEYFALIPMGFCYPGKGKSGDLPPRSECAPQWHESLFNNMKNIRLILLIGKYAQDYYMPERRKETLTEKVRNYQDSMPGYFPLPHPSPRNNIWQARNPWFRKVVLPGLQMQVKSALEK